MENQEDENQEVAQTSEAEENSIVLDQVEEDYQDQSVGGKENNGPNHGSGTGGRSTH
jgi:hypothetical protein